MRAALALALLASVAQAGRPVRRSLADLRPAASAAAIPELARLLEATGWTPTPELSGAFLPGRVFQVTATGHRLQLALGAAQLDLAAACVQESLEPVAIGYRTLPIQALHAVPTAPTAFAVPAGAAWEPSSSPAVWSVRR